MMMIMMIIIISFVRTSGELLYKLDYIVHLIATKYLESFEKWKMMEKISWTDRVRNEEVLDSVKDEKHILHMKRRTGNWIGDMLRNCVLKHVIEGKMETKAEVTGRRRRRRK
jgi:hypothetical protein